MGCVVTEAAPGKSQDSCFDFLALRLQGGGEAGLFPCISLFPGAGLPSVLCAESLTNACSDTSDPSGGRGVGASWNPH